MYPERADRRHAIIPSPVKPGEFFPMGKKRDGIMAVNALQAFKGRQNFLDWCAARPHIPVHVVGEEPQDGLPPNVTCLGRIRPEEMNSLYNDHEAVLMLPANPMPFERVAAEALLAGCQLITNELVGATSYPWFQSREEVAKHCGEAPLRFWEHLESLIQ